MNQLHVRAIAGRKVSVINGDGIPVRGRFVGYAPSGVLADDPDALVPDVSHYRRAIGDGDLLLLDEVTP